jgi:hypothetical protein
MLSGLRFFHSSSASLSRIICSIQPCHRLRIDQCWYGRINLIFKMRIQLTLVASRSASVYLWRPSTIIARDRRKIGGPALPRLEPRSCTCHPQSLWSMLFPSLTFWVNCLGFQPGTTVPFPRACTAARTSAMHGAYVSVLARQARAVPCSILTRGP